MTLSPDARVAEAARIMDAFLRQTGVGSDARPRRYLWTDAFAVCNALSLHARTGDGAWLDAAALLVDQVHRVLGRHRPDDPREGWISGLSEEEGGLHPTAGGLRIGKPLPERGPDEPPDPALEWEQDGQYFHYLTRWMHALAAVGARTGEERYRRWALELARVAHAGFVYATPGGGAHMVWKMSVDLTRPLVPSTGQHDPLDGLVTFAALAAETPAEPAGADEATADLETEIATFRALSQGMRWRTDDPLGLGGLLVDVLRVARLEAVGRSPAPGLLGQLAREAAESLDRVARGRPFDEPPHRRLPFRELGLAVGLGALERLEETARVGGSGDDDGGGGEDPTERGDLEPLLSALARHRGLRERIEASWLEPLAQGAPTWRDHLDINRVMLATSLVPDAYLE